MASCGHSQVPLKTHLIPLSRSEIVIVTMAIIICTFIWLGSVLDVKAANKIKMPYFSR